MKSVVAVLSLICLMAGGACAARAKDATNPLSKVIQMLTSLQKQVIADGAKATSVYRKFAGFCGNRAAELSHNVKLNTMSIADTKAKIEKAKADQVALQAKIQLKSTSIATVTTELKKATALRKKENDLFVAEEKDLLTTIDMLKRAIIIIEKGGASLMQLQGTRTLVEVMASVVRASGFSGFDSSRLQSLLQSQDQSLDLEDDEEFALAAPGAAAYTTHSKGIVGTLNALLKQAETQLAKARKTEMLSKNNFDIKKQALDDQLKFESQDMEEAKKNKITAAEIQATAAGDLSTASTVLAKDSKDLKDLKHNCATRATDFKEATKTRNAEVKALTTAKKVLQAKTSAAEKQTYSFVQVSSRAQAESTGLQVADYLRNYARHHNEPMLAQVASKIESVTKLSSADGANPFLKVKGIIQNLLDNLLKEAATDSSQNAYCKREMADSTSSKNYKQGQIEKLTTKINMRKVASAKNKAEIADLTKQVAEIVKSQAAMDKLRKKEKALYVKRKADVVQGIQGVKLALEALRSFYSKGMNDDDLSGSSGTATGIVGALEVVESDFNKEQAELVSNEEAAVTAYKKETMDNKVTSHSLKANIKLKTKHAAQLDKTATEYTSDSDSIKTELAAVLKYLEQLKKKCVAKVSPYAERKRRREAELEGLKSALSILSGSSALQISDDGEDALLQEPNDVDGDAAAPPGGDSMPQEPGTDDLSQYLGEVALLQELQEQTSHPTPTLRGSQAHNQLS